MWRCIVVLVKKGSSEQIVLREITALKIRYSPYIHELPNISRQNNIILCKMPNMFRTCSKNKALVQKFVLLIQFIFEIVAFRGHCAIFDFCECG